MAEPLQPEDWEARTRRARDVANVLPLLAALLLLPPVILVFAVPAALGSVPLIAIYVYLVWAVVILFAFLVAKRLEAADRSADPSPDERM